MKHLFICLCLLLFTSFLSKAQTGKIIAFVNPAAESRADADFNKNILPQLKAYAAEKDLEIIVKDVREGAPTMIVHTPSLVFQNHKGRSIFSARKHETSKYLNFIRTARVIPQKGLFVSHEKVAMQFFGRMKVLAKYKITDVKGLLPRDFDQEAFRQKITNTITKSLSGFKYYEVMPTNNSDRIFYMDFHPYLSDDGKVYVSSELYSQFNCIDPIFSSLKTPLSGNWEEVEAVFAKAGKQLGDELLRLSKESTIGDAFEPIARNTPIKTLKDLGVPFLKVPEIGETKVEGFEATGKWKVSAAVDTNTPMIQFTFLSPLDYYSGTVDNLEGTLVFPDKGLDGVKGFFQVKLSGVTMGDADLDQAITGFILNAVDFPEAQFSLGESSGDNDLWDGGQGADFKVSGQFDLSGASSLVPVDARLEPILLKNGAQGINVFATFQLKLKDDFKLEKGPDGPSPAKQTLVFYMNFLMEKE